MRFQVRYSRPEDVSIPGVDGKQFGFPFSIIPSDIVGTSDEIGHTKKHRIVIPISRRAIASWSLNDENAVLVLFEYARKFIKDALAEKAPFSDYTINAPLVQSGGNN